MERLASIRDRDTLVFANQGKFSLAYYQENQIYNKSYDVFFINRFTGKNCENDIVDCKESSCAPGATCIDLPSGFYCQCPFNLTGDDCRKSMRIERLRTQTK